jgi:hypothetical protein
LRKLLAQIRPELFQDVGSHIDRERLDRELADTGIEVIAARHLPSTSEVQENIVTFSGIDCISV